MAHADDTTAAAGAGPDGDEVLGRFSRHHGTHETNESQRTPTLDAYLARTRNGFDILALCTIWLSFLPFTGEIGRYGGTWWLLRIALSLAFLTDLVMRSVRAAHPWRYWRDKPLLVAEVFLPPIRVFFSLRLLRTVFRKGNLPRFMFTAAILAANLAIIVWACEQSAPDRNIDTVWQAFWWAIVTVTTTGYGDYTPVTAQGRVFAVVLMGLGVTSLAVVTATVAATFQEQGMRGRGVRESGEGLDDLAERLGRIETLLTGPAAMTAAATTAPDATATTGDAPGDTATSPPDPDVAPGPGPTPGAAG
jgi:voltage-gated potassium channel